MDTFVKQVHSGRRRRNYSDDFKRDAVAACLVPGVSMAAVALANGLNANVLRRWVTEHKTSQTTALVPKPSSSAAPQPVPAFIPMKLGSEPIPAQDIKMELRTGAVSINIAWPVSAASECVAWLAGFVR